jgi:D-alanyl-lipoteichoic acid acyltransferase DltB (MBOAT superfamily)
MNKFRSKGTIFRLLSYLSILLLLLELYRKHNVFLESHTNFIQIIVLFLMFVTIVETTSSAQEQINEMRKIEEDKRLIATESLFKELQYNNDVVASYIQHTEEGANVRKPGVYSWEWNIPQFGAYERYLPIISQGDLEFSRKIVSLYSQLESCKTIVLYIHQLLAVNALEKYIITNGHQLLEQEVKKYNSQLYDISQNIKDSFYEPISKLSNIIKSTNQNLV